MDLEAQREQQYREEVMARLEKRFGAARLPKKVKRQEAPFTFDKTAKPEDANTATVGDITSETGVTDAPLRLNSAWFDLTAVPSGMKPVAGVKYLWVIRGDGHLILGVEDPSQSPEAYGVDPSGLKGADAIEGLGHPSLAAKFGEGGVLEPGEGRIGGELFSHGGGWAINDHSGRYGSGRTGTAALLTEAAAEFGMLGITVSYIQAKPSLADGGTDDKIVALQ